MCLLNLSCIDIETPERHITSPDSSNSAHMRIREAFSSSYDFIFFPPSETHLWVHMQHLLFTRGDHVSVNHAEATLLPEKAISSEDGSESWGEAPNVSPPFICFPSPSIPLGVAVIAASRYRVQLNTPFLDTSRSHSIS